VPPEHLNSPEPCCDAADAQNTNTVASAVIPEIQEMADVSTRTVEGDVVRIVKKVRTIEQAVEPILEREEVEVQRVPLNRIVQSPPPVRVEGDTTIIPILEEVLIKAILVKEELHVIRRKSRQPAEPRVVQLRREKVSVEREPKQPQP
jgi:stress response protein YsnF